MRRSMLKSKIHQATVTGANLDYEGSLTIDEELLKAANIIPYRGNRHLEYHEWQSAYDLCNGG